MVSGNSNTEPASSSPNPTTITPTNGTTNFKQSLQSLSQILKMHQSDLPATDTPPAPSETLQGDGSVTLVGEASDDDSCVHSLPPPPGPGPDPDLDLEAVFHKSALPNPNIYSKLTLTREEKQKVKLPEVQCTHTAWCDCPMHTSYASGTRIPHLSEWALGSMHFPGSEERSTVRRQIGEDSETQFRVKEAKYWTDYLIKTLPLIAVEDSEGLEGEARKFVAEINALFPPALTSLAGEPVVRAVGKAVQQWKRDLDFEKLKRGFEGIVGAGRKDLMFLFQKFWPMRLRGVSVDKARACEPRAGELKEMKERMEGLDEARKQVMNGSKK